MNNFSPITVKQSPVVATPGKNLTGSPRIARDTIADIYNVIQKWNNQHIAGITIVKEIAGLIPGDSESQQDELQNLTSELYLLVNNCSEVVKEIGLFCDRIAALTKLHNEDVILFLTMSLGKMEKMIKQIHEAYENELMNKKLVLENIAFTECGSDPIFFACLWKYQLNIDREINRIIDTILIESGHRKITDSWKSLRENKTNFWDSRP